MSEVTVFNCDRGAAAAKVKIQLEIPQATFDGYKEQAKTFQNGKYTPKQLMENILINHIDGVTAK